MSSHEDRSGNGLQSHARRGRLAVKGAQEKRGRSSLNWRDPARRLKRRFMIRPEDLDIKGLGAKLCELLAARSGDTIAFHMLQDGSVRVVNYGR